MVLFISAYDSEHFGEAVYGRDTTEGKVEVKDISWMEVICVYF